MEIRECSFVFPSWRGNGPQRASQALVFSRPVMRAVAALRGHSLGFTADDDHDVGMLEVGVETSIEFNVVHVDARLGVRDWSGEWDDDYDGTLTVAVFADLEDSDAPPVRGDLRITGVEITQVTQSFQSAEHLDSSTAMPDNAVPLVRDKATGLRVWVDYDPESGLSPIALLSGRVTVNGVGPTVTLEPHESIVPRRATEISRRSANHTLNFRVPRALCRGVIEIECRVFDADEPASRSAAFSRTLEFLATDPPRIYGVGIHYVGQGMDLAAPDPVALLSNLEWGVRVYPTGIFALSGFTTIETGVDLDWNGFNSILESLLDLRGDSEDFYLGLLPNGVGLTQPLGASSGGAAVGPFSDPRVVAHELGHLFGRDHAPCDNVGRCANPPDPDSNYPHYGAFPSDSIGEFGYDPLANKVFSPQGSYDFMGYSNPTFGPPWVSPYTYTGLLAAMPRSVATGAAPQLMAGRQWRNVQTDRLFLRLEISRQRRVVMQEGFTFPAVQRLPSRGGTRFVAEVLDRNEAVLDRCALWSLAESDGDRWPLQLLGELAFDADRARALAIYEDDDLIHREAFGDPPRLECQDPDYRDSGDVLLRWRAWAAPPEAVAETEDDGSDEVVATDPAAERELKFLVQWEDEDGAWRGLRPRSTRQDVLIPRSLRLLRSELRVRVLAAIGLRTSTCMVTLRGIREDAPVIVGTSSAASGVVRAWALDHRGRTLPNPGFRWYDDSGVELAHGDEFDVGRQPGALRQIRVVLTNAASGSVERVVTIGP